MGLHKIIKNLGNKINAIQNFFAITTDYESRGQGFESSRAHHFFLHLIAFAINTNPNNIARGFIKFFIIYSPTIIFIG